MQQTWIIVQSYNLKPIKIKTRCFDALKQIILLISFFIQLFFSYGWTISIFRISLRFWLLYVSWGWMIHLKRWWMGNSFFPDIVFQDLYFKSSLVCLMSAFKKISLFCFPQSDSVSWSPAPHCACPCWRCRFDSWKQWSRHLVDILLMF